MGRARVLPLLPLALLASQVCFFSSLNLRRPETSVRAQNKKPSPAPIPPPPPPAVAAAKPASAPSPQAKSEPAPPVGNLTLLKQQRLGMTAELLDLAKNMGIQTNITRSDLQLFKLIQEKGSPKLKDLEARLVRADLGLMSEEPNEKASDFELVSKAMEKSLALEKAKAEIAELESSLEESRERSEKLLQGLKEIGGLVGVGGFAGIMQFFMSDEDLIKETKQKVAAKR